MVMSLEKALLCAPVVHSSERSPGGRSDILLCFSALRSLELNVTLGGVWERVLLGAHLRWTTCWTTYDSFRLCGL